MTSLLNLYRRLDLLQRKRWFRIAASITVIVACLASFGPLLAVSYDLQWQRVALQQVQPAVEVEERGRVCDRQPVG